jgi:hypothetical protein
VRRGLRLVVSALALVAVLSACGLGAGAPLVSAGKSLKVATRFIDGVRANDASRVCSMTTAKARRDLARLLRRSGLPVGGNMCAQTTIAPRKVRVEAMRPFLGVLGFARGMNAGGNSQSSSTAIEWSQTTAGRYAVVVIRRSGAHGLLVDSIRLEASCKVCG